MRDSINALPSADRRRRWVVKVGSSSLTADGQGLDRCFIDRLTMQIAELDRIGCEVVLVSSGSIAEGLSRLGHSERPERLHELQAAAAIGQMGLMHAYRDSFERHGMLTGQVLLTHSDIAQRQRYANARRTLAALLERRVIPIVNENDTVSTEEIKLGDNDTLAAMVVGLVQAHRLVILTDQSGLFDRDPRVDPAACLLERADPTDAATLALAAPSSGAFGSGGMRTKVLAAAHVARGGIGTVVADGSLPDVLIRLAKGESLGTTFAAESADVFERDVALLCPELNGALVLEPSALGRVAADRGAGHRVREADRIEASAGADFDIDPDASGHGADLYRMPEGNRPATREL